MDGATKWTMADTGEHSEARLVAAQIIAAAEAEAAALLEEAERQARERGDVVVSQYQARLDVLLDEERAIRERLAELGVPASEQANEPNADLVDDRDAMHGIDIAPDASLADFMKSTLRDEVQPD